MKGSTTGRAKGKPKRQPNTPTEHLSSVAPYPARPVDLKSQRYERGSDGRPSTVDDGEAMRDPRGGPFGPSSTVHFSDWARSPEKTGVARISQPLRLKPPRPAVSSRRPQSHAQSLAASEPASILSSASSRLRAPHRVCLRRGCVAPLVVGRRSDDAVVEAPFPLPSLVDALGAVRSAVS